MFIISTAKVRQINDTTKYFVLIFVNGSIFFPEQYNPVRTAVDPVHQGFNLTEIKS
jgi:hypothetical protein